MPSGNPSERERRSRRQVSTTPHATFDEARPDGSLQPVEGLHPKAHDLARRAREDLRHGAADGERPVVGTAERRQMGPSRPQGLALDLALRAVTVEAAWSIGMEGEIGSIRPGKRADFTVLAADPVRGGPPPASRPLICMMPVPSSRRSVHLLSPESSQRGV